MRTITVPLHHYREVLTLAASEAGRQEGMAAAYEPKGFTGAGETIGKMLCEAYAISPELPSFAMAEYMRELRKQMEDAGKTPPSLDRVLQTVARVLRDDQFGEAANHALVDVLKAEVPQIVGDINP